MIFFFSSCLLHSDIAFTEAERTSLGWREELDLHVLHLSWGPWQLHMVQTGATLTLFLKYIFFKVQGGIGMGKIILKNQHFICNWSHACMLENPLCVTTPCVQVANYPGKLQIQLRYFCTQNQMGFQLIMCLDKSWCWQQEGGRSKDQGVGLGMPPRDSSCLAMLMASTAVAVAGVCWSIDPSPLWARVGWLRDLKMTRNLALCKGGCWWRIQPGPWDPSLGTTTAPNHIPGQSCFAVWPCAQVVKAL